MQCLITELLFSLFIILNNNSIHLITDTARILLYFNTLFSLFIILNNNSIHLITDTARILLYFNTSENHMRELELTIF